MSKQIAVRLPDELVQFVDDLVRRGDAASRASVVTRALKREQRRRVAERDVELLKATGSDSDLDSLVEYLSGRDIGLDD